MIIDDPYQEPTPEQIEKMREWYNSYVVPRIGTEFFFVSGGRMSMTRGEFPKPLNMEPGMIMPITPQYRIDNVWNWQGIIGFLFYTAALLAAFKFIPEAQFFLFGLTLGSSGVALFRPFDKLVKYTEVPTEYPEYIKDAVDLRSSGDRVIDAEKFHAQYKNDPTRETPSGQ